MRLAAASGGLLLALCALGASSAADARGSRGGHHYASSGHHSPGVARDSHGRIKRSSAAKTAFQSSHPCPATGSTKGACPGYVIDHVTPLKRGGADAPSNMQWQTKEAAREKDKWE